MLLVTHVKRSPLFRCKSQNLCTNAGKLLSEIESPIAFVCYIEQSRFSIWGPFFLFLKIHKYNTQIWSCYVCWCCEKVSLLHDHFETFITWSGMVVVGICFFCFPVVSIISTVRKLFSSNVYNFSIDVLHLTSNRNAAIC